jgi:mono/diheme cytochrome c family protein
MSRLLIAFAAVLALIGLWPVAQARAEDGKQVFLKKECNECHAVEAAGIAKLPAKDDEAEADEEEGEEEDDTEPPDLSGVGKEHDAKWLGGFIQKKVKNDEGKKHRKRFKGSDAELEALVAFLGTLQTPVTPATGK